MAAIDTELIEGAAVRFLLNASRDGSPWDITGGTVTFIFTRPDDTSFTKTATVAGTSAYYDTLTTDIDQSGNWTISFHVVLSPITVESQAFAFGVLPAAG